MSLNDYYDLIDVVEKHTEKLNLYNREKGPIKEICGFGHIGDGIFVYLYLGNLHLAVIANEFNDEIKSSLEPFIFQWLGIFIFKDLAEKRGSISAEHGLGLQKANYINYSKPENMITIMNSHQLESEINESSTLTLNSMCSFSS